MRGRGVLLMFGALRVVVDGVERTIRRGMVLEFRDTLALQEAANSGFGEFDQAEGDDTVATVLEGSPRREP